MSESDGTRGEWVVAATCTWLHEAQLLKSVLESVGIVAAIPNEHTLGVQPLYSNLLGRARVNPSWRFCITGPMRGIPR